MTTAQNRQPVQWNDLLELIDPPSWHRDAACQEHPAMDWFTSSWKKQQAAVRVCERCLVRVECLSYALSDPTITGVWGGTTDAERQAMRRDAA